MAAIFLLLSCRTYLLAFHCAFVSDYYYRRTTAYLIYQTASGSFAHINPETTDRGLSGINDGSRWSKLLAFWRTRPKSPTPAGRKERLVILICTLKHNIWLSTFRSLETAPFPPFLSSSATQLTGNAVPECLAEDAEDCCCTPCTRIAIIIIPLPPAQPPAACFVHATAFSTMSIPILVP